MELCTGLYGVGKRTIGGGLTGEGSAMDGAVVTRYDQPLCRFGYGLNWVVSGYDSSCMWLVRRLG